jgi:plastocyanin
LWHGASGAAIILPASLAAVSLVGFLAATVCVLKPRASAVPNHAAVNLVVAVLLVLSVILGIGLLRGTASAARVLPSGGVKLVTENMAYSKTELAARTGDVTIALENHDLFWHTFTIDQLGVDIKVPMQATDQIRFQAPPGVYTFHCTIPGHEMLGMHGTLTVK